MKQKRSYIHSLILGLVTVVAMSGLGCTNAKLKAMIPANTTITLEIQNYCPLVNIPNKQNFAFKNLFVYNSSAYFDKNQWTTDYDRDGLSDTFETTISNINQFGISFLYGDSNNNGFSDLVKVRLGIAAGTFMPTCNSLKDTDGDGLNDCEENLLGTSYQQADYDGDGVPDGIELRFGMNPTDPNDAYTSMSGDGFTNLQKAQWGVPVSTYIDSDSKKLMPIYTTRPSTTNPNCYTFDISNINILSVTNGNQISVVAVEDNQIPPQGLNQLDREVRNHLVLIPPTIQSGVTVVVPDGINGAIEDGVGRPLIIVGGS